MIEIDKSDKLYKYLLGLGVDNIDDIYTELASNGRATKKDANAYFYADFDTAEVDYDFSDESRTVMDYYLDIKKLKQLKKSDLNSKLNAFSITKEPSLREEIVNSLLNEAFYLSVCYKANYKDLDLMDIVQNSNIGLLKAVEKYDPNAKIDIDDYILFYIREQLNTVYKEKNNG